VAADGWSICRAHVADHLRDRTFRLVRIIREAHAAWIDERVRCARNRGAFLRRQNKRVFERGFRIRSGYEPGQPGVGDRTGGGGQRLERFLVLLEPAVQSAACEGTQAGGQTHHGDDSAGHDQSITETVPQSSAALDRSSPTGRWATMTRLWS